MCTRCVASPSAEAELTIAWPQRDHCPDVDDYEVVAEELSQLAEKMRDLEDRLAEVERVNARLEEAALTTARGLGEVSRHWDAVYDAMRRADRIDRQISSERDHEAAAGRLDQPSD